jgi:hypothetical protein
MRMRAREYHTFLLLNKDMLAHDDMCLWKARSATQSAYKRSAHNRSWGW